MLKRVILNSKSVNVPLPIGDLKGALDWVERSLLTGERTITKIELDGEELDLQSPDTWLNTTLAKSSKLEIRIDTPRELALQSIDALRHLSSVIERELKPIAVNCWQAGESDDVDNLDLLSEDLDLVMDLILHIAEIPGTGVSLGKFKELSSQIGEACKVLDLARANKDWKTYAKVMLNALEPLLIQLHAELGLMQRSMVDVETEDRLASQASQAPSI